LFALKPTEERPDPPAAQESRAESRFNVNRVFGHYELRSEIKVRRDIQPPEGGRKRSLPSTVSAVRARVS
jgi:hypothetical protein